jgi:hypothetical protein
VKDCLKPKKTKCEKHRDIAEIRLHRDLDLVYLVDTIYKLRASLKVLVSNNQKVVMDIKRVYHNDKSVKTKANY